MVDRQVSGAKHGQDKGLKGVEVNSRKKKKDNFLSGKRFCFKHGDSFCSFIFCTYKCCKSVSPCQRPDFVTGFLTNYTLPHCVTKVS